MTSLNMGSMNFGLFPMLSALQGVQVRVGTPAPRERPATSFSGTPYKDIENIIQALGRGLRHALRVRVLRRRPSLQPGPLPRPRPGQAAALRADHLRHPGRHRRRPGEPGAHAPHRRQAVRHDYQWSILAAGRHQMPLCTMGATDGRQRPRRAGGQHLRRHAANSPRATPTRSPRSARILEALSLEIATPAEARAMLALKGGDQVAF